MCTQTLVLTGYWRDNDILKVQRAVAFLNLFLGSRLKQNILPILFTSTVILHPSFYLSLPYNLINVSICSPKLASTFVQL